MPFPKQAFIEIINWTVEFLYTNNIIDLTAKEKDKAEIANFCDRLTDTNAHFLQLGNERVVMRLRYEDNWVIPVTLYADMPKELQQKWKTELKNKYSDGYYFAVGSSTLIEKSFTALPQTKPTPTIEKDDDGWHKPDELKKLFLLDHNMDQYNWWCTSAKLVDGKIFISMGGDIMNQENISDDLYKKILEDSTNLESFDGIAELINFLSKNNLCFKSVSTNEGSWIMLTKSMSPKAKIQEQPEAEDWHEPEYLNEIFYTHQRDRNELKWDCYTLDQTYLVDMNTVFTPPGTPLLAESDKKLYDISYRKKPNSKNNLRIETLIDFLNRHNLKFKSVQSMGYWHLLTVPK